MHSLIFKQIYCDTKCQKSCNNCSFDRLTTTKKLSYLVESWVWWNVFLNYWLLYAELGVKMVWHGQMLHFMYGRGTHSHSILRRMECLSRGLRTWHWITHETFYLSNPHFNLPCAYNVFLHVFSTHWHTVPYYV